MKELKGREDYDSLAQDSHHTVSSEYDSSSAEGFAQTLTSRKKRGPRIIFCRWLRESMDRRRRQRQRHQSPDALGLGSSLGAPLFSRRPHRHRRRFPKPRLSRNSWPVREDRRGSAGPSRSRRRSVGGQINLSVSLAGEFGVEFHARYYSKSSEEQLLARRRPPRHPSYNKQMVKGLKRIPRAESWFADTNNTCNLVPVKPESRPEEQPGPASGPRMEHSRYSCLTNATTTPVLFGANLAPAFDALGLADQHPCSPESRISQHHQQALMQLLLLDRAR